MTITIEPLDLDRDLGQLHRWVTHPRSAYWGMQGASVAEVATEYSRIDQDPHHDAFLGRVDGRPLFLVERYDPAHSPLAGLPELRAGDVGMHVLVAPPDGDPTPGLTTAVFDAVMAFCFEDPAVRRVVVEPDARNDLIRAKNLAAGFTELREIELPDKVAVLSVCAREDWLAPDLVRLPVLAGGIVPDLSVAISTENRPKRQGLPRIPAFSAIDHLTPELMGEAQRRLVAKAISEYAHERLVEPVSTSSAAGEGATDTYVLEGPASSYSFTARVHGLDHWVVDAGSLTRTRDGEPAALDVQELVAELAEQLGIPDQLLPTYLEELASTLASTAWKLRHSAHTADELLRADYQTIEAAMTEGHPAFVANNGRIGFGLDDYAAYAPEAGQPTRLVWVAARREHTHLALGAGEDESRLYADELGEATVRRFRRVLASHGLDPDDYLYLPVHPWQWVNKLAITFAPDLARRDLVLLGETEDEHRPQQSIRTFFNASRPERHYVKTALAIQNMGFLRGLSPAYMEATPAINDWVAQVVEQDPTLRACGFGVLRELASVGYTGDAYHRLGTPSPHRKMIAALWRESPVPRIGEGERLATMASLLHRDRHGDALVTAMVKASPLDAAEWVRTYLRGYLRPLVHCLYAYDLAFMPHGENLVLVIRDHVPVRVFMKDIGEEVAVMGPLPLPPEVERIRGAFPDDVKALAVHTDVFDGFLRYVAAILSEDGLLADTEFWAIAREVVQEHAADHPELAEAVARYDLLRPEFRHSCLNRLQLRNTLQMVDLTDQAESLIFAGTLQNPIADATEEDR